MRIAEDIILAPIVTEKSADQSIDGKYTFKVAKNATKVDIRNAVEQLFNVKVLKVNTLNYDGKKKRVGVHQGMTSSWKKAIVKIDTDPGSISYLTKGGKEEFVTKKYKTSIEEFGFVQ
jgi:large subunit ribosomal protein L23